MAFALLILLCSCGTVPDVIVVDATGRPIAGATVERVSLSINGPSVLTDSNGGARLPWGPQEAQWVSVSKPGYQSKVNVSVKGPRPIRVVLSTGDTTDAPQAPSQAPR